MSSHHIVREKQEPALLLLGLDTFPNELLGQLLEWSPTVITTPQTAEKLIAEGIKIDCVISNDQEYFFQSDIKLIPCSDGNLTGAALQYLTGNGYPAVNIVTDEFDLSSYERFAGKINLVVFYSQSKIYPVTSGFSKWKAAGETIKILNASSPIDFNGLEKAGGNEYITIADGFFSLYFDMPFLFIAEYV